MTDKVELHIDITPETHQQIEALAQRRGYTTLRDYLLSLIESDVKAHGETLDTDEEDDPVEGFRKGWHDVMTGNTFPVSTLWDGLDDE